jgi:hypothetical protein
MIKSTGKLIGDYGHFRKYSGIFIETGSCYGRSIELALKAGYIFVRSVEAKEEFYNHCKALFANDERVKLYLGKSVDKLEEMIGDVKNYPCVFWLDAHVSGEASAGYQDWVEKQGDSDYDQHKILKRELEIILTNNPEHIILIDDQNGLNWMNTEYMKIIHSFNPDYNFELWDEQMGENHYKDKILVCLP